jgi:uncharacterized membrane protein YbhN (UPF0104 family)
LSGRRHVSWLAFGLKLAITLGLLAYLLRKVDIAPVVAQIRAIAPAAAAAAEAMLLVQLGLLALRWQLVNRIVDAPMRLPQVLRLTAVGHFFNQVLPSGFAGDAARAWLAAREGVRLGPAVRAIVSDRVIGLLVLAAMAGAACFAWPARVAQQPPGQGAFRAMALLGVGGLAAFLWAGEPFAAWLRRRRPTVAFGKLLDDLHRVLFRSRAASLAIVGLALAVQVCNVAAVQLCAAGMHVDLAFDAAALIVPAVMLVSLAPVSFAGWGVREGAMIVGLGFAGVAAVDALAVSVSFGVLQVVLGVPGAALWLARRGKSPAGAQPPANAA